MKKILFAVIISLFVLGCEPLVTPEDIQETTRPPARTTTPEPAMWSAQSSGAHRDRHHPCGVEHIGEDWELSVVIRVFDGNRQAFLIRTSPEPRIVVSGCGDEWYNPGNVPDFLKKDLETPTTPAPSEPDPAEDEEEETPAPSEPAPTEDEEEEEESEPAPITFTETFDKDVAGHYHNLQDSFEYEWQHDYEHDLTFTEKTGTYTVRIGEEYVGRSNYHPTTKDYYMTYWAGGTYTTITIHTNCNVPLPNVNVHENRQRCLREAENHYHGKPLSIVVTARQ